MFSVRGGARAWLLAGVCAAGCGDDDGSGAQAIGGMDGGGLDGGVLVDGAVGDASLGEMDAALGDGGPSVPVAACSFGDDGVVVVDNTFVSPDDPISLALRNDGAALGWVYYAGGKSRLRQAWLGSTSDQVMSSDIPSSALEQRKPASVSTSSGYLTVWSEESTSDASLRALAIGPRGSALGPAQTIATGASVRGAPVLTVGSDGNVLVVWQVQAASVVGRAQLVSPTGTPIGEPRDIPAYGPTLGHAALESLGDGYVLAWVDEDKRRVHLLRLDAQGAAVGTTSAIDSEVDAEGLGYADGTVDLATNDRGGAVVFDVLVAGARSEVRFRAFDLTVTPNAAERVLTDVPATGLVPAMVPLRGGYAVAYRSTAEDDRAMRVLLLDRFGSTVSSASLAPIVDGLLPVMLRASPDGQRALLSWVDTVTATGASGAYQLLRTWIACD